MEPQWLSSRITGQQLLGLPKFQKWQSSFEIARMIERDERS
jgi:hypothetical protein